jgi:hypothetical protein
MKKRVRLVEDEVGIGACMRMLCMSSMSGHTRAGHEHGFLGQHHGRTVVGTMSFVG